MRRSHHRRRHGRALGPQAIIRPDGHGRHNVILVDSRGNTLRTLKRGVTYTTAVQHVRGQR